MSRRKPFTAAVLALLTALSATAQPATPAPDQQALDAWRAALDAKEPSDDSPCHKAEYPSTEWKAVPCLDERGAKRLGHWHSTPRPPRLPPLPASGP